MRKQRYTIKDLKKAYTAGIVQASPDQSVMETKRTFEQTVEFINNQKEEEALKTLGEVLEKFQVRKHLNVNGFGYSPIEREIVKALLKLK